MAAEPKQQIAGRYTLLTIRSHCFGDRMVLQEVQNND